MFAIFFFSYCTMVLPWQKYTYGIVKLGSRSHEGDCIFETQRVAKYIEIEIHFVGEYVKVYGEIEKKIIVC